MTLLYDRSLKRPIANRIVPKNKKILIFIHVPKCAGSTIGHALASGLAKDEFLPLHYSRLGEMRRQDEVFFTRSDVDEYLEKMNGKARDRIRFISGHLAYPGIHRFFSQKPQYIVYFRHPLARSLSHYRFLCQRESSGGFLTEPLRKGLRNKEGQLHSFPEWLENNPRFHNYMVNFFKGIPEIEEPAAQPETLLEITSALKNSFIGLTETLDKDLAYFSWKWPIKSREKKNVSLPKGQQVEEDGFQEIVEKYCALDLSLYNWACRQHADFVRKHWEYYPSIMAAEWLGKLRSKNF